MAILTRVMDDGGDRPISQALGWWYEANGVSVRMRPRALLHYPGLTYNDIFVILTVLEAKLDREAYRCWSAEVNLDGGGNIGSVSLV